MGADQSSFFLFYINLSYINHLNELAKDVSSYSDFYIILNLFLGARQSLSMEIVSHVHYIDPTHDSLGELLCGGADLLGGYMCARPTIVVSYNKLCYFQYRPIYRKNGFLLTVLAFLCWYQCQSPRLDPLCQWGPKVN